MHFFESRLQGLLAQTGEKEQEAGLGFFAEGQIRILCTFSRVQRLPQPGHVCLASTSNQADAMAELAKGIFPVSTKAKVFM